MEGNLGNKFILDVVVIINMDKYFMLFDLSHMTFSQVILFLTESSIKYLRT